MSDVHSELSNTLKDSVKEANFKKFVFILFHYTIQHEKFDNQDSQHSHIISTALIKSVINNDQGSAAQPANGERGLRGLSH